MSMPPQRGLRLRDRAWRCLDNEELVERGFVLNSHGRWSTSALLDAEEAGKAPSVPRNSGVAANSPEGRRTVIDAWGDWRIEHAVLRAKIRAYYPGEDIARQWEAFDRAMGGFYLVSLAGDKVAEENYEVFTAPWFKIIKDELGVHVDTEGDAADAMERGLDLVVARILQSAPEI
jgi:hypothetical protein